jgi:NAD(P)-dependent dehydrogenase (short-subunit alcohol dehydrogenase family)
MTDQEQGCVALVFGASGGIGSALSRRLISRGWNVVLAGRDASKVMSLADELGVGAFAADATEPEAVQACVNDVISRHGRLDAVAHCVGSLLLKPAHTTTDQEWQSTLSSNLTSAFNVLRASVPAMRQQGGSVVFVSSAAARRGLANHEAIAAAKAGLIGLALSAAATYARQRIRVNCVAPGLVRTPLANPILRSESALKYSTSLHALGRIGEPSEVASAIHWLMRPEQSWITGQVIGIDGGLATVQSNPIPGN